VAATDRRRIIIQIIPAQATLIGEWLDSAAKPSGPRPGQSLPQRTTGFLKAMDLLEPSCAAKTPSPDRPTIRSASERETPWTHPR